MKYIHRIKYIQRVYEFRKTSSIILFSGLKGCGKSVLLSVIARELRNEKPPVRILQLDAEDGNKSRKQLLASACALGVGPSALFIDNAEQIEELSSTIDEISKKYTVTIFITGGTSGNLETALKTTFANELAIMRINPFSYREFLEIHELSDSRKALELYSRSGGLPESAMVNPSSEESPAFLAMRANSFLLTEIIETHSIRNPGHLRSLLRLISLSTGEALSARIFCAALSSERITISPQAVLDYLEFCRDSGILVPIPVLDIKTKRILESGNLWYFGDTGLRSAFVQKESPANNDRAVENLVLLHLIDEGWKVFQGRVDLGKQIKETVSFVCEKEGKRKYIQIIAPSAPLAEKVRKREALLSIRDAWPKIMVDSEEEGEDSDGIRTVFVRNLLLE